MHREREFGSLLCSPGLVASPQVVDVDDESSFILTDHVPHFALVDPLVLLQGTGRRAWCFSIVNAEQYDVTGLKGNMHQFMTD